MGILEEKKLENFDYVYFSSHPRMCTRKTWKCVGKQTKWNSRKRRKKNIFSPDVQVPPVRNGGCTSFSSFNVGFLLSYLKATPRGSFFVFTSEVTLELFVCFLLFFRHVCNNIANFRHSFPRRVGLCRSFCFFWLQRPILSHKYSSPRMNGDNVLLSLLMQFLQRAALKGSTSFLLTLEFLLEIFYISQWKQSVLRKYWFRFSRNFLETTNPNSIQVTLPTIMTTQCVCKGLSWIVKEKQFCNTNLNVHIDLKRLVTTQNTLLLFLSPFRIANHKNHGG